MTTRLGLSQGQGHLLPGLRRLVEAGELGLLLVRASCFPSLVSLHWVCDVFICEGTTSSACAWCAVVCCAWQG